MLRQMSPPSLPFLHSLHAWPYNLLAVSPQFTCVAIQPITIMTMHNIHMGSWAASVIPQGVLTLYKSIYLETKIIVFHYFFIIYFLEEIMTSYIMYIH